MIPLYHKHSHFGSAIYTDIAKKMNPTTSSIPNLAVLFFLYLKLFTRRTMPTTKQKSMTQNPMIFPSAFFHKDQLTLNFLVHFQRLINIDLHQIIITPPHLNGIHQRVSLCANLILVDYRTVASYEFIPCITTNWNFFTL